MKKKILFWIDATIDQFGTAKYLQNDPNIESFAIIDTNKGKNFYENQNIVEFKDKWFFRDNILKQSKEPDFEYLSEFEKKYKINLWNLAYSDIIFNEYNEYYRFNKNEILSIMEQMCKFFERVLNETNPDFLVIKITDASNMRLLQLMCSSLQIKVLSQGFTRYGYRHNFSSDNDIIEELNFENKKTYNKKTLEELQKYLKGYAEIDKKWGNEFRVSKNHWLKAGLEYLSLTFDKSYRDYYYNYGRTPLKALQNELSFFVKKKIRKNFLDKNTLKELPNEKFIYFPLQLDPERTILIPAPFYSNQLEVIKKCAKSIPVNYKLFVKEHPMQKVRAWRKTELYKEILSLPNVELLHPDISNEKVMKKAELVITITGTSGLEAAFQLKPSIVLADVNYQSLPSVHRLKKIEELPENIKKFLDSKVNVDDLNDFTDKVLRNSFEFDEAELSIRTCNAFYHGGFLFDREIDPLKMETFLKKNEIFYKILATQIKNIIFSNSTTNN